VPNSQKYSAEARRTDTCGGNRICQVIVRPTLQISCQSLPHCSMLLESRSRRNRHHRYLSDFRGATKRDLKFDLNKVDFNRIVVLPVDIDMRRGSCVSL
jgi:hypothetical protein